MTGDRQFINALERIKNIADIEGYTKCISLPVRRMPDEEVKAYFKIKADALQSALATEVIPPPCTDEECWNRRKCKAYCTAWEHCDIGLMERGSKEV